MNLLPYTIAWALLASIVAGLAFYRRSIASKEDDMIHVNSVDLTSQQVETTKKLEQVDRWGKLLTVIAGIAGAALAAAYLYQGWFNSTSGN